jgi:hypothetical protein
LVGLTREPADFSQRPAQEELDLSVRAAQLVGGPADQCIVDCRIEP